MLDIIDILHDDYDVIKGSFIYDEHRGEGVN